MRWLIVGAGALGGYFGGRLLEAGADVTFLLRPRRLEQIRKSGLIIRSPQGDTHFAKPTVVTVETLSGPYDLILLGCKAYDLDSAMDAIAPAVDERTAILPLLNGLGHIDRLAARFGAAQVLGSVAMISAALDADGAIHHLNDAHTLIYGELDGAHSPRMQTLQAAFRDVNFNARASDAILQEMWEKWAFIAATAGATCLMRATIGDIVQAGAADLSLGLLEECAAIAAANGHALRPFALEWMRPFVTNRDSTISASMLKDIERGARTEGQHILGELLARAKPDAPAPRLLRLACENLRAYAIRRAREAVQSPEITS